MRESAMNAGPDPNWDGDLFHLYDRRLVDQSWQDGFADEATDRRERSWSPPQDTGADYSRALFGGPGADLLGAGYSAGTAERWEGHAQPAGPVPEGRLPRGPVSGTPSPAGPLSGSMPSISQPSSPLSQSLPAISESLPALADSSGLSGSTPPERDELTDTGTLMRPYARTRGRTRTDYDLAIETLVSTSERGRTQAGASSAEHRSICGLCMEARSVAEIAALLRLPLGVVRVLVGDMASLGLLLIHNSGMLVGDRPSMEFLERVLSGLRKL
jgi:hypothetical protein